MEDNDLNIKRYFSTRSGSIVACILEIAVGVLLLINPVGFTSAIIIGAGIVMVLAGAVNIIRYFTTAPELAAQQQLLFKGLLLCMVGAACIVKHDWFLTAFPLLTVLYAIGMLLLAAARLQKMADMRRLHLSTWYLPGIAALLAAAMAVIILINPFGAVNVVWTFVAISLIAQAVVEIVTVAL